jgi:hypothetical protein
MLCDEAVGQFKIKLADTHACMVAQRPPPNSQSTLSS